MFNSRNQIRESIQGLAFVNCNSKQEEMEDSHCIVRNSLQNKVFVEKIVGDSEDIVRRAERLIVSILYADDENRNRIRQE